VAYKKGLMQEYEVEEWIAAFLANAKGVDVSSDLSESSPVSPPAPLRSPPPVPAESTSGLFSAGKRDCDKRKQRRSRWQKKGDGRENIDVSNGDDDARMDIDNDRNDHFGAGLLNAGDWKKRASRRKKLPRTPLQAERKLRPSPSPPPVPPPKPPPSSGAFQKSNSDDDTEAMDLDADVDVPVFVTAASFSAAEKSKKRSGRFRKKRHERMVPPTAAAAAEAARNDGWRMSSGSSDHLEIPVSPNANCEDDEKLACSSPLVVPQGEAYHPNVPSRKDGRFPPHRKRAESDDEQKEEQVTPTNSEELRDEAKSLLGIGDLAGAKEKLDVACETENSVDNLFVRSFVHMKLGDFGSALKDCEAVLLVEPHHTRALLRGARLLRMIGIFSQSRAWIRRLENDESARDQIREESLVMKRLMASFVETLKVIAQVPRDAKTKGRLEALKSMCPGWPCIHLLLALHSCCSGQYGNEAAAHASEGVKNILEMQLLGKRVQNCAQDTADVLLKLLRSMHRAGLTIESEMAASVLHNSTSGVNRALSNAFKQEVAYCEKLKSTRDVANTLFKEKMFSRAIAKYNEALMLDPHNDRYNAVILCNRAAAFMAEKRYNDAVIDCSSSLEKNPEYTRARIRRAHAYMGWGKHLPALRDLEAAHRAEPSSELASEIEKLRKKIQDGDRNRWSGNSKWTKFERRRNRSVKREETLYEVLGVSEKATAEEIKKAYHKKALIYHPDKASRENQENAEDMFKKISGAYNVLRDTAERAAYDRKQSFAMRFANWRGNF